MSSQQLKILIIDDNPDDTFLVSRMLARIDGWTASVESIHDGQDSQSAIDQIDPDVVLLDYMIGCDTGTEILQKMRETGDGRPVIAMTGRGDEKIAAEITRAGADEYLVKKNLSSDVLREAIQKALSQWDARQRKKAEADRRLEHAERLSMIGETVASISHNMKGILTALKASGFLVDQALDKGDCEKAKEMWGVYKRSGERLSALTEAMLNYSKDQELKRQAVSLNELAAEMVKTFKAKAAEADVELTLHSQDDMPEICCDRELIASAVQGLVENAIDACRGGQGSRVIIQTRLGAGKHTAGIGILDDGPGIDNEILEKIFDPFFTTKGSKGTGLGLAIAHKSVRAHGGQIEFHSRVGRTQFIVWLPASQRHNTPLAVLGETSEGKRKNG